MRSNLPQIARDAQRLLAAIEQAVLRFPRRHKYRVGSELCDGARGIARATVRAWRDRDVQLERVEELCTLIDDFKITMQLAKAIDAWPSFNEFEAIVRLVSGIGQQSGGWRKRLKTMGQIAQGGQRPEQSAPILSSRAASQGATP